MTITLRLEFDQELKCLLGTIDRKQDTTLERTAKIMAEIDDLKAQVIRLTKSVSDELKAIADKLSKPNPDAAAVGAVASAIGTLADSLDAETLILTGTPPADGGPPVG